MYRLILAGMASRDDFHVASPMGFKASGLAFHPSDLVIHSSGLAMLNSVVCGLANYIAYFPASSVDSNSFCL